MTEVSSQHREQHGQQDAASVPASNSRWVLWYDIQDGDHLYEGQRLWQSFDHELSEQEMVFALVEDLNCDSDTPLKTLQQEAWRKYDSGESRRYGWTYLEIPGDYREIKAFGCLPQDEV